MPRRVEALAGEKGVVLPDGWVLDGGDQVVVADETWAEINSDAETLGRLTDLGFTSALPDPVPTFRDIQRATSSGNTGLEAQINAVEQALTAHAGDTTNIHGIADTTLLETQAGAQAKADQAEIDAKAHTNAHAAQTINVHGIADTSKLAWLENTDVTGAVQGDVLTLEAGIWQPSPPVVIEPWEQTYNFTAATDEWVVTHNQNTYAVHVEIFDTNHVPTEGNVVYPDPNTVRIEFYYPQTGYVRAWTN